MAVFSGGFTAGRTSTVALLRAAEDNLVGRVTHGSGRWQRWVVSSLSIEDAYVRYADELVRYATLLVSRSAAPDVVGDTFADLLRSPDGSWASARDPRAFLFGAVANRARMHHRQNGRRRRREELVVARPRPVTAMRGMDEIPGDLLEALEGLSVQQRAVIYLTYWHDWSVAQVADALGIGDGSVRRQLARARDRLRGVLS